MLMLKNESSRLTAHGSQLTAQRHEFNPNVVAIAERMLITVWMISFQVSLFFILINELRIPSKSPPGETDYQNQIGGFC